MFGVVLVGEWMKRDVLADDKAKRINGSYDEDPFGYTKFLTLHDQACVQTEADKGVSCNEENPFRDLQRKSV